MAGIQKPKLLINGVGFTNIANEAKVEINIEILSISKLIGNVIGGYDIEIVGNHFGHRKDLVKTEFFED